MNGLVGIQDSKGVLQCGAYHYSVAHTHSVGVSLKLLCRNPTVQLPVIAASSTWATGEVAADGDAQVLAGTCFQCLPMEVVADV